MYVHVRPCRYAIATDGAQHLFAGHLIEYNWFQRHSVDVMAVLACVAVCVVGVVAVVGWKAGQWVWRGWRQFQAAGAGADSMKAKSA